MRRNPFFMNGRVAFAVLLTALSGVSQARTASGDEVRTTEGVVTARAGTQHAGPWWLGFGEGALASLQQAARGKSDTVDSTGTKAMSVDAQVTVAYVAMRTYNVRWRLAMEMRDSLGQQRELLAASTPVASTGEALATLDERRVNAERFAATLLGQRNAAIAALAQLAGSTPQAMTDQLQAALAISDMPALDAETPERLPRSVLMARRDVSVSQGRVAMGRRFSPEAEHQLAIGTASLAGWIDATSATRSIGGQPSSALPDVQDFLTVAARAETEVSVDLADLQRRTIETSRLLEIVKTRQLDLEASRRRLQVGAGSEQDVIKGYQVLLVNDDELAVSAGGLAYAWIRLQASTGGQAIQASSMSDE